MNDTHAISAGRSGQSTDHPGRRSHRTGRRVMLAGLASIAVLASLVVGRAGPASASTLNGTATIVSPGTTTPLPSGGSADLFGISLPAQAACEGDTATHGYHVYSYLVPQGTNLSTVTFTTHPSVGSGLFESNGKYYGPINTAVTTGQITGIPNDFQFSQVLTHGVTLPQLLYTGSGSTASGIWESGLACANSSGALTDNWNTVVTFNASSTDSNGFTWAAVPGIASPVVTGIAPTSGPVAGGTSVVISGFNLASATAVRFGTASAAITAETATSVTASSPAGSGDVDVTVTTADGTSATSAADRFAYLAAPVFTSASKVAFTEGTAGRFTATASGNPIPVIAMSGSLPSGVTFSDGILSGTATATGAFPVTFTASNGVTSDATQQFTLTIVAPPATAVSLTAPVVGIASTPDGSGYWLVDAVGDVAPRGTARNYGSLAGVTLNAPIVHIVATPNGRGYWLVAADGGIFAFGDAGFYGSTGGMRLNAPVVGLAATPNGRGYWLVAADGGIFAFGEAGFAGSMGGQHLNRPVVGMVADPAGGYWLVATDGGIFAFRAPFLGSTGALTLNQPVNGMAATPNGRGYWLVAADGGIFAFGDAGFHGSAASIPGSAPVAGMATDPVSGGYWLLGRSGGVYAFYAPFHGAA